MSAGRARVPATFWLLGAPDSLAQQSRRNPDGTGLGTFDDRGRPVQERQALEALEDRAFVGMGATVMNGARIGHDSIVAAGSLVAEGTQIPPRSLVVGVPGRVRRELTEAELEKIARNAAVYVEKAERYAATASVTGASSVTGTSHP